MNVPVREQDEARIVRELIEMVGGLEGASGIVDLSTSQLSRYQSPHERDSMPLRVIRQLENVTHGKEGHPHVTRFCARHLGYSLMKRPEVPAARGDIMKLLAKQARERGETEPEMLDAVADSEVDADEAARLIPLYRRSLETTAQMLAELEAIAGRDVA